MEGVHSAPLCHSELEKLVRANPQFILQKKPHSIAPGPTAAPDNLRVDELGPNYAELSWDEPSSDEHNGIIRFYTLFIVEEETSTNFTLTSSNTRILMTTLHPFYHYSVTVAAVTTSPGPFSQQLTFRTMQTGS